MARDNVTSLDVARRAGVSQSAVSRVFTPGASVSQSMTDRVLAAADELGYRPNVLARTMITGKSRLIGLVVAYLDNQFYPDIRTQGGVMVMIDCDPEFVGPQKNRADTLTRSCSAPLHYRGCAEMNLKTDTLQP